MKVKLFLVIISLLVFSFISCDSGNGTNQDEINDPKSIKIDNIIGLGNMAGIMIFPDLFSTTFISTSPSNAAIMYGDILGGILSVDLMIPRDTTYTSDEKWNGNGNYYVAIVPIVNNTYQMWDGRIFTNGTNAAVKVSITKALTVLNFSKFKAVSALGQQK